MGANGWNELQDRLLLRGTVTGHGGPCKGVLGQFEALIKHAFGKSSGCNEDGDWSLFVTPAPGFEHLMVNKAGKPNPSGQIECEVEPPDNLDGLDAEDASTMRRFFNPLVGQQVTVVGTWVEDKSHGNRTEIHPITSIVCEFPFAPGKFPRKVVDFVVFSDDSANFPAKVPHSHENRTGTLQAQFPDRPPDNPHPPAFSINNEIDMAESKNFQIGKTAVAIPPPGQPIKPSKTVVRGEVKTGANGFYYARLILEYPVPDDVQGPGNVGVIIAVPAPPQ